MASWFLNNKKSWFICIFTFVIAAVSYWFLPDRIPMHFNSQGIADSYSGKGEIFLMPVIQAVLIFFSGRKKVKDWFLSMPPFADEVKYYLLVFAVTAMLLAGEATILLYCLG